MSDERLSIAQWIAEQIRNGAFSSPRTEPAPKSELELSIADWIAQQIQSGLFSQPQSDPEEKETKI